MVTRALGPRAREPRRLVRPTIGVDELQRDCWVQWAPSLPGGDAGGSRRGLQRLGDLAGWHPRTNLLRRPRRIAFRTHGAGHQRRREPLRNDSKERSLSAFTIHRLMKERLLSIRRVHSVSDHTTHNHIVHGYFCILQRHYF